MKSSNSLFLDEEYKYDCEHKINYFQPNIQVPNGSYVQTSKNTDTPSKLIGTYTIIGNNNESTEVTNYKILGPTNQQSS